MGGKVTKSVQGALLEAPVLLFNMSGMAFPFSLLMMSCDIL